MTGAHEPTYLSKSAASWTTSLSSLAVSASIRARSTLISSSSRRRIASSARVWLSLMQQQAKVGLGEEQQALAMIRTPVRWITVRRF
jgi:hypothetical protein